MARTALSMALVAVQMLQAAGLLMPLPLVNATKAMKATNATEASKAAKATRDRYVFMAGLEGAGHHFFSNVFEDCVWVGDCGRRNTSFYLALHKFRANAPRLAKEWLRDAPNDGRLYPLNTIVPHPKNGVKMLSYPDARNTPNLMTYWEAANISGNDLKVVVLLRNATELLQSDLVRWDHDEERLMQSGEAMLAQLKAFDQSKIMCMWFHSLGTQKSAEALSRFLDIGDTPFAKSMTTDFSMRPSSCVFGPCKFAKRIAQLQSRIAKEVCHGTER